MNGSNRMQRTTAPPSFDVYRSLPVSASLAARNSSSSPNAETVSSLKQQQQQPENKAATSSLPFPPVPVASLNTDEALWFNEIDVEGVRKKLEAVSQKCELRRTPTACELVCTAQADDGLEVCQFTMNIWQVPEGEVGADGKYIVVVDRSFGCPYLFKQVLSKAFSPVEGKNFNKFFRVPKLPECFCDEGKGIKKECVENAIKLASSDIYEQRRQGLCALATLSSEENEGFKAMFKSVDGPLRIKKLQTEASESDSFIKRAIDRILAHCA